MNVILNNFLKQRISFQQYKKAQKGKKEKATRKEFLLACHECYIFFTEN